MTHRGSNSSALRKHLTPSVLLKPKHQFKPRLNQRCVSSDAVDMGLVWLPRLKRSIPADSVIPAALPSIDRISCAAWIDLQARAHRESADGISSMSGSECTASACARLVMMTS